MAEDPLIDTLAGFVTGVVTNAGYGWTMSRVLAASLAVERAIDDLALLLVAQSEPWSQQLFADLVWPRVSDDLKRRALRRMLDGRQIAPGVIDVITKAVADITDLRNAMAHGTMNPFIDGTWSFTTYWKGRADTRTYSGENIERIIQRASQVAVDLNGFHSAWLAAARLTSGRDSPVS